MIVLDTDHLTELGYGTPPGRRLAERIEKASTGDAITIISVQEQMKGLLARIAKAKPVENQERAYAELGERLNVVRRAKQGASYQVKDLLFQNLASRNYRVLQLC